MNTTRTVDRAALLLLAVTALLRIGTAQDSTQVRRPRAQSSPQRIITSVPFNGMRYFIAIAPLDTGNIDHMPMVGIPTGEMSVRIDSNIRILPDSLLRRLPRKEGPQR